MNQPRLFEGEHFSFCKKRMEIFIQSIDLGAWNFIVKCPFNSTKEVNGELVPKEWDEKKNDEKRKVHDKKTKHFNF